jgi:HAD superfamily hydrolase (TIGR01484 family)
MGKPFKKEIDQLFDSVEWAFSQDTKKIEDFFKGSKKYPFYIVGSGGSLSACYYLSSLIQSMGIISKAITPLELYYCKAALRNCNIIFISSSGKNTDILFGFDIALVQEPKSIRTICMRLDSPLSKLANLYPISDSFDYSLPSKKDGFLATNSLVAYFALLCKAFIGPPLLRFDNIINDEFKRSLDEFASKLTPSHSLTVLYGGWGQAVAHDLESKFTEAALGNVLLSDYRNFGHGRHHWFAKRGELSAIIALVTPEEEQIAKKTLSLIPSYIPQLIIKSSNISPMSSIELLIKSFHLVNVFGEMQGIDPGRPGVPEFGSKLYHLKYSSFYKKQNSLKLSPNIENIIIKKTNKSSLNEINLIELDYWKEKHFIFFDKLKKAKFNSIVFDYDGTLCSQEDRFKGYLSEEIVSELNRLLKAGIIIGIATGRGPSVRKSLQSSIKNKNYWKNVIIGYYNGSDIGHLDDNSRPNIQLKVNKKLVEIEAKLKTLDLPFSSVETKLRPYQLTIETTDISNWVTTKKIIQNLIMTHTDSELQLLESSHSMDIVVRKVASKLNVIDFCKSLNKKPNENCLTIGDKGQWPGNDYELLSTEYSLSVDEVSSSPDSCWSHVQPGITGVNATLEYLRLIKMSSNYFTISI